MGQCLSSPRGETPEKFKAGRAGAAWRGLLLLRRPDVPLLRCCRLARSCDSIVPSLPARSLQGRWEPGGGGLAGGLAAFDGTRQYGGGLGEPTKPTYTTTVRAWGGPAVTVGLA